MGHSVDVAENGQEAVDLFYKNKYDLVLMDIMMPVMDGIEAAALIKDIGVDQPEKRNVPIIAMTANALKGYREQIINQGLDGYISKPFKTAELLSIIVNKFSVKT